MNKIYLVVGIILFLQLLPGCSEEQEINSCGPYPELQKIYDSEVLDAKFQPGMALDFIIGNGGHAYDFMKTDGDSLVFHFIRYFQGEAADAYYEAHLLFQVPAEADLLYIPSEEFSKYKVIFRSLSQGENGYLNNNAGCIELNRIASDQFLVDVNIIYDNYTEKENLRFTDIFVEGPSYHNDGILFGN